MKTTIFLLKKSAYMSEAEYSRDDSGAHLLCDLGKLVTLPPSTFLTREVCIRVILIFLWGLYFPQMHSYLTRMEN